MRITGKQLDSRVWEADVPERNPKFLQREGTPAQRLRSLVGFNLLGVNDDQV